MSLYNVFSGGRSTARQPLKYCFLLLLLFVPLVTAYASPTDGDMTLSTTVPVGDIGQETEIWLARLTGTPDEADSPAIGLRWAKDASAWFPTWQLELVSAADLLPGGLQAKKAGAMSAAALGQIAPVAGHTYQATLSYSPHLGALAIKVVDETDGRTIYADGFAVPTTELALVAPKGDTIPYYVPVGTNWTIGTSESGAAFMPLSQFESRDQQGAVRITSPEPIPSGHYRVVIEHGKANVHVASIVPQARETVVPLPMAELPLGHSTLRVDYVLDGEVLLSDARPISLGRVDFSMQPVVTERAAGVLKTAFDVRASEAFSDKLAVEVAASIDELVWDDSRRKFDLVPYAQDMLVHEASLDLSTRATQLHVAVPLPDRPGNWRVQLTPHLPSQVSVGVYGNERQFSTHTPAELHPGDEYTIVVLPDTQYFARRYPDIFTRMTDWITANAAECGIAAVLHVGDMTDDNSPTQWESAHAAMSLLNDVVPYVFAIGNHDMVAPDGSAMRGYTRVNTYFPADMAERYSNVTGTMIPGRMENHYALLSIAGTDYLVISLEFWPPDEAVAWANEVAQQYPNHKLILLTHSYTSSTGSLSLTNPSYPITQDHETTVNHAVALWELLLRLNENSFMAISGHVASPEPVVPHRVARNIAGNHVFQLLFNWQNQPMGGNGWLGLLTFKPNDTVGVNVFSPYLGEHANKIDGHGHTSELIIDLQTGDVQRIFGR